jgi:CHAT domain-containing protein
VTLLQDWADDDARHEYYEGEQQKCAHLAFIHYHQASIDDDTDMSLVATSWHDRAESCNPSRAIPRRDTSKVELQVYAEISRKNFNEALAIALNDANAVESFPRPSTFQNAQSCSRVATTLHMKVLHCLEHDAPHSEEIRQEMFSELLQAMQWAVKALNLYRSTVGVEVLVSCTNHLWLLIQHLKIFNESIAKDLSQAFLVEIGKTERFCDDVRRSAASSSDIESWLQKRRIVSHKEYRKLYSAAVISLIQSGDFSLAWIWNQKGKARGFSDLFGLRALVPQEILETIRKDETAASLLDREHKSLEDYLHASPQALVGAARKVEADRAEMRSVPILAKMLSIREGAFDVDLQTRELQTSLDISGIPPEKVRFVDWFIPVGRDGVANEVHIFVRDTTGKTESLQLSVTIPTVEAWVRKAYKTPDGAEPWLSRRGGNAFLSQLDGLLEGLDKLTNEDDLLVLSPSGVLNSVPLHGLKVAGQRLIDRNMIVYSSSAAVLRQCLSIANARSGKEETSNPKTAYFAVYEEPKAKDERAAIFENMEHLAEIFPGPVKLGPQVTKTEFKSGIVQSSMILFHGHAEYNADDPLKSALVLSDGSDIFDNGLEDQSFEALSSDAGRAFLTVSEIFESRMMENAPHYTIIACDSSTQDIGAGDEPLGLLSALLYTGAASVLGCLWPIDSEAGRIFSLKFYKFFKAQIMTQSHSAKPNVLNLAAALRDAVREMMSSTDTDRPFFWAPFVLHGSWFHIPS